MHMYSPASLLPTAGNSCPESLPLVHSIISSSPLSPLPRTHTAAESVPHSQPPAVCTTYILSSPSSTHTIFLSPLLTQLFRSTTYISTILCTLLLVTYTNLDLHPQQQPLQHIQFGTFPSLCFPTAFYHTHSTVMQHLTYLPH